MPRHRTEDCIPTVTEALDALRVDELKSRGAMVVDRALPSRKGELVSLVTEHLAREDCLRELLERRGHPCRTGTAIERTRDRDRRV